MTPLQIKMMLHHYAIAAPYAADDPAHANSPAVFKQRALLLDDGLIEPIAGASPSTSYGTTARGDAYVEALCAMPLPVCKWAQP